MRRKYVQFAEEYLVNGQDATAAAMFVGYTKNRKSAQVQGARLLNRPDVIRIIEDLENQARFRHNVTVDALIQMYSEVFEKAKEAEQFGACVSAVNGIAKITGLERQVIEHVNTTGMTDTSFEIEFTDDVVDDVIEGEYEEDDDV